MSREPRAAHAQTTIMATAIARRLLNARGLAHQLRDLATRSASNLAGTPGAGSASESNDPQSSERSAPAGETSGQNTTHFGYRDVPVEEKKGLVHEVFERVAPKYDVMNDLMSGGLHRIWKDHLVSSTLRPGAGQIHLDVAGGTGDVAFRVLNTIRREERIQRLSGRRTADAAPGHVVVLDINPHMLAEGRKRAEGSRFSIAAEALDAVGNPNCGADLSFIEGDAERLLLADGSVDSYTIAFGLRNVTRPDAALREAARVLRRGGRFLCLEFSHVELEPLRQLYDAYSFAVIPALGQAVAGDAAPYQYLVESIRKFPRQDELCEMMEVAGMGAVSYENLTGGVVAIHSGFKL